MNQVKLHLISHYSVKLIKEVLEFEDLWDNKHPIQFDCLGKGVLHEHKGICYNSFDDRFLSCFFPCASGWIKVGKARLGKDNVISVH